MFISFLLYILILNFNVIKSLQTDKLTIKSIYPSLTTLETTTDYKKKLRKLIRKHALPLHFFTKKNIVTNAQAGKLKLPYYLPLLKSKGINTITQLPYSTHIKNATVKQTRATVKSIPTRKSHYPTEITSLPRTITYTLHKNPYFEKSVTSKVKKIQLNERNIMKDIDNKVENAKHSNDLKAIPKRSLPTVQEKQLSTKGAVEKRIEEEFKIRRKLKDDVLLDVLNDDLGQKYTVEPGYVAPSYVIRNISHTSHNYKAMFNTEKQNLSTDVYYRHSPNTNRPIALLYLEENTEEIPKFEQRKTPRIDHWYSRKMSEVANLDLKKFKIPLDNPIPSETHFISNVDNLVESPNPADFYYENPTETNQETDGHVTDAGVTIVYKAIDKDLVPETESNLITEIETEHDVIFGTSQIEPTTTSQILPIEISRILPTRTSKVVPSKTLKNAFIGKHKKSPKLLFWGIYSSKKTQPPWRLHPPENPNPTTTSETPTETLIFYPMKTPIKSKRKMKKKFKKLKTTVNAQQAYIKEWPMPPKPTIDRKAIDLNRLETNLVTNYKMLEEHTLNPGVSDILRRLNNRASTKVPINMRRDWANWGYRRGKTGDPHIYLDLYNNFFDVNYVTK